MFEGDPNKKQARREIAKGAGNILFGGVGTVGSGIYIAGTSGIGAAAGGATAMVFSLGEVGIGMAQVADGIKSLKSGEGPNSSLEKSSTLPGLVANSAGLENAEIVDAVGGLVPGALTGGNLKTIAEAGSTILDSKSIGKATFNALDATDAVIDVTTAVGTGVDKFNSNTSNKPINFTLPVVTPPVTPADNTKLEKPKPIID
jgi:hypothetical protein